MKITLILSLIVATVSFIQATPVNNPYQAVRSAIDLSGQPVRARRASYDNDYYICYPSSVVYSYHRNSLESDRRSDAGRSFSRYDARRDRADREGPDYTDVFGK